MPLHTSIHSFRYSSRDVLPVSSPTSSQLLLQKVLRPMVSLIVHMNIRPLYIRKTLQFYLKFLSYVMCSSQCSFWVHDDVYFDNEAGTGVVGTHSVYLEDGGGVCHRWKASVSAQPK